MTSCSESQAGFSLFELLVAVAVMGLALALIAGTGRPAGQGRELKLAAREVAGALRVARAQALATNRPSAVDFDLDRHVWRTADGLARPLPRGVRTTVTAVRGAPAAARITFLPDGSSSGGQVAFEGHGRMVVVGVDWISGRVSAVEAN